jgi:2-polyprenyl-3-methyl-5-hydroxy-6-metoxy-1,4-benzoquinol methylase
LQRVDPGKSLRVLDMGAGDGGLTLPYLSLGAQVVAADASEELLHRLREKANPHGSRLTILIGDIFQTLERLQAENCSFDIVCASSFLHHIPDYLRLCRCATPLVRRDGVFFTFQDPLRYDTLGRPTYAFDRASYFWWRLFQGNYVRGIKTRIRRLAGKFPR